MLLLIIGTISWLSFQEIKLRNRLSYGEKILFNSPKNLDKEAAIKAFWWKNYNQAIRNFNNYLREYPNDPEVRIYLENAKIGNKEVIKIGVAVPISSNPPIAQEILRGVAQAQQEINHDGGVNGKFLQIQIANDDNNPEIAQKIAQIFVKNYDILAIIGHNSSDATVPAADIYQAGKLVMISPTSTSTKLTDRQDQTHGNYIYRTVISSNIIAETLAAGQAFNGMVMAVPWEMNISKPPAFVKNAKHLWGKEILITWRTATAFDATKTIAIAMQKKGSTRIGIQQALSKNFSFSGITGTIKFLPWGDRISKAVLVQIQPDTQALTGYNFVRK
jgi:ABC-type branched-subunit amino acid transport system substrate-binding protein